MLKKSMFAAVAVLFATSVMNTSWACLDDDGAGCSAKAEVQAALEKGDYEAFKTAAADSKCIAKDKITAENFPRLVEAHRLMKAGKKDEAKAIKAELGLGHGGHDAKHGGCSHHAKGSDKGHKHDHKKGHKCSGGCGHH